MQSLQQIKVKQTVYEWRGCFEGARFNCQLQTYLKMRDDQFETSV